ncbi:PaaX family transcriptional regulator C-terminal domain-containing protein [Bartonella sp. HY761]|uniref:PaaX family transcriptional regulator C-terminal domain-containing protein n=1 Tax=Bartonella sp. HY761 TaxID=2979330 RepID=UPI0021FD29DE|nr:PaaX family transcriptional regulator C-terminal domain-containing protein [Bartonella sp. HY761]UXN07989.1 PaaX family transcriptional regulator [Bartonella sp. HY761]
MFKFEGKHFLEPPRCSAFLITIYGDVVEPRGGVLWMGNLIDLCAVLGFNGTLVRTSMSRLVAAGQLQGERIGRKSYYRLQEHTREYFHRVGESLFNPQPPSNEWFIVARRDIENDQSYLENGFAVLNRHMVIGSKHAKQPSDGLVFEANIVRTERCLKEFVANFWDLTSLQRRYETFFDHYSNLLKQEAIAELTPFDCLIARLALVHDFRLILQGDPHLPKEALPQPWAGDIAHVLFAKLYLALTPKVEQMIARDLRGDKGSLVQTSVDTDQRIINLQGFIARKDNLSAKDQ